MKLLIVEDDRDISEGICEYFRQTGYEVIAAYDGEEALVKVKDHSPDLVILDIMLPKLTGLIVLHELRKESSIPVVMLTAMCDEYTQIASFDGLADDYVTKPFSVVVLAKRVEALLRRGKPSDGRHVWHCRGITVDFSSFTAEGIDGPIEMTPREIKLLKLLVENTGRVLTREQILNGLWSEDRPVFDRTVDSHIKNLRKKLRLDCIATVTGVGYKLEDRS